MPKKTSLPGALRNQLRDIISKAEAGTSLRELTKVPRPKTTRPKPSRPKTRDESFRDLDSWYQEAVAGMPDESLARAANVSVTAVLEWRKAKSIRRKRGHERRREIDTWALDPFGDGDVPEIHEAAVDVKGQWDLPHYVLRVPLDYDELTRAVWFLHHEHGSAPDTLAKAFGLRVRDVEMAIAVETAHLESVGVACASCGRVCDPAYGNTCSTRCRIDND